jgi:hypothetical protein
MLHGVATPFTVAKLYPLPAGSATVNVTSLAFAGLMFFTVNGTSSSRERR